MSISYSIKIEKLEGFPRAEFDVLVTGGAPSEHKVFVREEYFEKFSGFDPEDFVRESFKFLLGREPNTSILSEFDISEIMEYFPDYEENMKK